MKRLLALLCCIVCSGCVSVLVQKEIQVKKDADGRVIETVETERIIQRGTTNNGVRFDYLKANKDDAKPVAVSPL